MFQLKNLQFVRATNVVRSASIIVEITGRVSSVINKSVGGVTKEDEQKRHGYPVGACCQRSKEKVNVVHSS